MAEQQPSKFDKEISNQYMADVVQRENLRSKSLLEKLFGITVIISFLYMFPIMFKPFFAYLVANFSINQAFLILFIGTHTLLLIKGNMAMYFIYTSKIPFLEKYRVSSAPWPWESDPEKWRIQFVKCIKTIAFYNLVLVPLLLSIQIIRGIKTRYDIESYPGYTEMITQVLFCAVCEDFCFYWIHRIFHHPKLYPYIHKMHHEHSVPVSIVAEYSHPIEFIFQSGLSAAMGFIILRDKMHAVTAVMFIIIRITEAIHAHSGYEFPWSPYGVLPLSSPSSFHYFHHFNNVGNFGTFFEIWDRICGTKRAYVKYKKIIFDTMSSIEKKIPQNKRCQ